MKKKKSFYSMQNAIVIPVIVFALITWGIWWLYPNASSFVIAFQDRTGNPTWANFVEVWSSLTRNDGILGQSLRNTLIFSVLSIFVHIPLVVFVCYFLYKRIFGYKTFRIIFYLPAIIPTVALAGTFKSFISVTGPLGEICNWLNIPLSDQGLLADPNTALGTIVFYYLWTSVAGGMLIINGAMARIPIEVLEAAKIEGCGIVREAVQIVLPLIWPTVSTLITLACTSIIGAGGSLTLLLQPDTQYGTSTLQYWMFKQVYGSGYGSGDYGVVSAMGLCFTVVLIPFITGVRKLMDKIQNVEY